MTRRDGRREGRENNGVGKVGQGQAGQSRVGKGGEMKVGRRAKRREEMR